MHHSYGTVAIWQQGCMLRMQACGPSRKKSTTLPTTFGIQEQSISAMREEDTYCHLGVATGYNKSRNPEETIKGIKGDVEKIYNSLLAPWQKIDATKTIIYPRLDFILPCPSKLATRCSSSLLPKAEQEWCRLVTGPIWPRSNTPSGSSRAQTSKPPHLPKTFSKELRRGSWDGLHWKRTWRGTCQGKRDGGDNASLWSDARNVSRRLSKRISIQWVHNPTLGDIKIKLPNTCKTPKQISLPAGPARDQIMARLRQALQESYLKTLIKKPDIRERSTRSPVETNWRFIHRARLNVLPLNGVKIFGTEDKQCRVCNQVDGTLPHVLQHCCEQSAAGRTRINQRVPEVSSNLRPDIMVTEEEKKRITIIEVAIPFENRPKDARERKIVSILPLQMNCERKGGKSSWTPPRWATRWLGQRESPAGT
ncbi:hypothetical protein LAZ67_6003840 [Cordylochernes scorpioides]|uniref:Reverse transcriptase n=1 Tax=Cordylochernes scorpioides TaxID=51811 RepID=A0ABY6KLX7_9ARAC|nr:hypothetical protein LAZ67_6003840 [Cordylochernes scorpioides]